jgi:hypothetical protein
VNEPEDPPGRICSANSLQEIAMNMPGVLLVSVAVSWLAAPAAAQRECDDDWAQKYDGRQVNVCARMVGGVYLSRSHRQPTLLYLDRAFDKHIFSAVIYGQDRAKFGEPEKAFLGKMTCVKGVLTVSGDRAEIVVTEPGQLSLDKTCEASNC